MIALQRCIQYMYTYGNGVLLQHIGLSPLVIACRLLERVLAVGVLQKIIMYVDTFTLPAVNHCDGNLVTAVCFYS